MLSPKERLERHINFILNSLEKMQNTNYQISGKQAIKIRKTINDKLEDTLIKLKDPLVGLEFTLDNEENSDG